MNTDTQIQKDVLAELEWEPSVDSSHIGVEVSDGVVTLAGHVSSFAEKWDAERAAQRVYGVKALAIEMDVRLPGTSQRTDGDIARTAKNALEWLTYVPTKAVNVTVEAGFITLTGEVDWEYQRQAVTDAVRNLMGVTGLSDQIIIKPKVSLDAVKSDIEAALKRRAHNDAKNVSVSVNGAEVTLAGTVHSWLERDLVMHSAWGTPGVKNVVDHTTIRY
ncbi:BON domain-containing protein [Undibacterium sp. RTI2.1]|uniref:BON domain-containing protein n=1 Tax=unclassified Undibacterium TaxID=2630295 RepID=UPI002AB55472|nr:MULTISPECIES: BON domain-containing protein [unclassified Undibacterium]MDY7537408.1 BON domain-containing protein [Undibacterium sp. 5I1]MEB0031207.1 BON domain-containing protein [Undibacterium sp. RTI2.1]MEB0117587.1 BON domain-containing protein [Undibacterium sp. RTI2.2]MEB0232278.1 BON domain-containing protein [Undibacterium sp. 10I3]MEB0259792.1 BON domain-containing protein [Undibacterium sp. 5I1]